MKIVRLLTPIFSLAGLSGAAHADFYIDNFSEGNFTLSGSSVGSLVAQQNGSASGIIGGQRDVLFGITSNPFNRTGSFEVDTTQGASFLSSGPGMATKVQLDYDGFDVESPSGPLQASASGLNLNLANTKSLDFDFLFSDLGVHTTADLYTYGGGHSQGSFLVASNIDTPTTYNLDLSNLQSVGGGPAVNLQDVDRIVFTFDGNAQALDFGLRSVKAAAVPEPASLAAMALGLVGIVRRRRKKA